MLQGYKITRIIRIIRLQGYKDNKDYKAIRLQGYKATRLQGYRMKNMLQQPGGPQGAGGYANVRAQHSTSNLLYPRGVPHVFLELTRNTFFGKRRLRKLTRQRYHKGQIKNTLTHSLRGLCFFRFELEPLCVAPPTPTPPPYDLTWTYVYTKYTNSLIIAKTPFILAGISIPKGI